MSVEQAKAFWEVVTSDTSIGESLVGKIKGSNPSSPEINYDAVVAIAKDASFGFTVDEFLEAIYGHAGQSPWDIADIWVDEASNFIYAVDFIAADNLVDEDSAKQNSTWSPRSFSDGAVW